MTRPPPHSRRRRAFTLIELLLTMTIFAVILAGVNAVFFGSIRLWQKSTATSDLDLPRQYTIAILRRDLTGIVAPGGTYAGILNSQATIQGLYQQDVGTEIYTTTGNRRSLTPWGDLQAVAYVLRDPTNATSRYGRDLVRVVRRNLQPVLLAETTEQRLLGGVQRIDFSFYDGTSWKTTWNSTNDVTPLPKAIKVEITETPEGVEMGQTRPSALAALQVVVPVMVVGSSSTNANANSGGSL